MLQYITIFLIYILFPFASIANAQMQQFSCIGTEPPWAILVKKDKVVFTGSDFNATEFKYVKLSAAAGYMQDYLRYYDLIDTRGRSAVLILRVAYGGCEDFASEHTYSYSALFKYNDVIFAGCADKIK